MLEFSGFYAGLIHRDLDTNRFGSVYVPNIKVQSLSSPFQRLSSSLLNRKKIK